MRVSSLIKLLPFLLLNEGLSPDKEHRIRVRAVNEIGESEPLLCVEPFIAEDHFGTPTAPGRPELVDSGPGHLTLAWDPPKNDGGAAIKGYQVELRRWRDASFKMAAEIHESVAKAEITDGIEAGQTYAGRVRALNAAGSGPWSLETERLLAEPAAAAPKLFLQTPEGKKISKIRLKEGESLRLKAKIEARPAAEEVLFSIGGIPLTPDDDNVKITKNTTEGTAELNLQRVTKRHSGILTISAHNRQGETIESIAVEVTAAPERPPGVLEVLDVHKGGCKLRWQRSREEGNSRVTYNVERRYFGFLKMKKVHYPSNNIMFSKKKKL